MAPFLFSIEFETYVRSEKRYSEHTVIAYQNDLAQFFEYTGIEHRNELPEITSKVIRGWMVALVNEGYTNKSVNRKLSALRTYFRYLKKTGVVDKNPLTGLNGPKVEKRLPQFAKESELEEEQLTETLGLRDALIVELFYQTGMRLNELIELTTASLNDGKLKVKGKRNKERIIPVSKSLQEHIETYRKECAENGFQSNSLILTDKGNKLYPKFVYRKINAYLASATELQKCSPHVLRHTFATHMLNNGAGLETIKALLGHANLAATQVYTHNSFAQLNNIYSLAHPRGRKTG
ncbi:tyrosine-type recombinase/integrase [Crocinitomicaceae bacterium CZZ-1]|uniref:Tyrosine-type recombinase/integrase n=1 Tax=Taishania pollutisoli TaxID=2766479 RepID=A0A8J6U216_9FLAO|nr:tyrosine-type recombinase/integrase [Taishania pollutisoli]MBC9811920.1 tyrosine-type recombinase/integrase [Taishania pollutisoli]